MVDAVVAHFMRFLDDPRTMPVIWHQSLLAFVQRLVTILYFSCFYCLLLVQIFLTSIDVAKILKDTGEKKREAGLIPPNDRLLNVEERILGI